MSSEISNSEWAVAESAANEIHERLNSYYAENVLTSETRYVKAEVLVPMSENINMTFEIDVPYEMMDEDNSTLLEYFREHIYKPSEESEASINYSEMFLYEMANIYGSKVKTDKELPFSFYFSRKDNNKHGIRVKLVWNPSKMRQPEDGYMYLHGNWDFVSSPKSKQIDSKLVNRARAFFKKYKALFAAVWLDILEAGDVEDFFKGVISWEQLTTTDWELPEEHRMVIRGTRDIEELEAVVREYQMFDMLD